ncbi:hypothetical protein AAIR98_001707 [Elusimicrobium simillimum]|uniref:LA_2272 family surface repeat-containing protein n=1 Tax=Elusimicrobium simillimum TaxID=3143438 RepID=UPI003C6FA8BA
MKKFLFLLIFILSAAAIYAQENTDNKYTKITPFKFSLTPVYSVPWNFYNVYGLDTGILAPDTHALNGVQLFAMFGGARRMNGLQIASLATLNHEQSHGVSISALINASSYMKGLQIAVANINMRESSGLQLGAFNFSSVYHASGAFNGAQIGFINRTNLIDGVQIGFFNTTTVLTGVQIGVFNYAGEIKKGVQIGPFNYHAKGTVPFLPIINGAF